MVEYGDVLGDRYRVVEVLSGGMGQIYICEFLQDSDDADSGDDGSLVALKTFQRRYFFDNAARQSFVREASTWLRIADLPHVMPVIGIEQIGDQPFVLMPAVPPGLRGERSIADLLEYGPLDPETALRYAVEIVVALRGARDRIPGLVHGDLKPANVLLLSGSAYLSDFGLVSAISLGYPDLRLEGSWAYRAPELWGRDAAPPSVSSDVYAFGALLFEILVRRPPVIASQDDRETWSVAHQHALPTAPDGYSATGVPAALMALAIRCLAKATGDRPRDFGDLFDHLRQICDDHDAADVFARIVGAAGFYSALRGEFASHHLRIRGLFALGEPAQALEELEAIPPAAYDPELWVLRGTALSLLNRPEEALEALTIGLEGELGERQRVNALSEYALARKRLGRFDEAGELYEHMMTEVPDDMMAVVVVNLATVYMEQDDGESAVRLLEPFVRRTPGIAEAWANLGDAYAVLGRYDDAVWAFGKALVLAPQNGLIRIRFAAVLMDHLGRLDEAWSALDAAFDSGHESREWFVRMLAVSLLLDRQDVVGGMLEGAQERIPEEIANAMVADSIEMAKRLVQKFGDEPGESDQEASLSDEPPILTAADHASVSDETAAPTRPSLPFLNLRYYDGMFDFTIDFYESIDNPNFVGSFRTSWRRATRDPRFAAGGGAALRGSAFYITMCPECGITVLTNRDVGKRIRCRMCGNEWHTNPVSQPRFDRIVAEVSTELGIEQTAASDEPGLHVLFVQPQGEADVAAPIAAICLRAGMVELPHHVLIGVYLLREALSRGLAQAERPWSVWAMPSSAPRTWARDSTPEQIGEVVRELRALSVTTMSTSLTAEQVTSLTETIEDVEELQLRQLREALRSGTAEAKDLRALATILDHRGDQDQAERTARAAIAADDGSAEGWEVLGRVLFHRKDYVAARDALEQSVARNPTSGLVISMLAACHKLMGDEQRADELYARAMGLHGRPDLLTAGPDLDVLAARTLGFSGRAESVV
jgi:tetratricopeptide (TPR) repeat protein